VRPAEDETGGIDIRVADTEEIRFLLAFLARHHDVTVRPVLLTGHRRQLGASEETKLEEAALGGEHLPPRQRLAGADSGPPNHPGNKLHVGVTEAGNDDLSDSHEGS